MMVDVMPSCVTEPATDGEASPESGWVVHAPTPGASTART